MPESQDDFERAWAEIVDDLTAGGSEGTAPAAPDERCEVDPPAEEPTDEPEARDEDRGARGAPASTSGLDALFQPLRRERPTPDPTPAPAPGDFVDGWEDEGHFVPPPPPEIPEGTPVERLAWAGVIGGPLVLLLIAVTGWAPPPFVGLGAGLATLGGFVTLVWHLPERRPDGWDDGARL